MRKSKIIIDSFVLDKIAQSNELTDNEKINFLKYVGYMTLSERRELSQII
ncbi:MAG: hypothetical protein Q8K30_02920 [Candidatus Gracilibacteria bacterium]|nr:hypothetical protein [Candidatus Gracilibacteria bacterium]